MGSLKVGDEYFKVDSTNKTFKAGGLNVDANGTTVQGNITATSLTITGDAASQAGLATSDGLNDVATTATNA
jgi:phage baseplate assembly protein gpV